MNDTGVSQFNQARIEWAIRLRYSPMPHLDMKWLTSNLNAFRIGELRTVGKIWEIMVELDGELAVNFDKRAADLAGLEWSIVSDGSADGDKHAAALQYFYDHIKVTRALDQDVCGGVPELLYQMSTAHLHYYSCHEMLMRIDNPAGNEITAEFRHTPVWFFESRRGYLGWLPHIFDMYGMPCLSGEWLTIVGMGWMRSLSIAYAMKHFPLRDWLLWCSRYGSGFLEGITDAQKDSPEWNEAVEAMRALANDGAVMHSRGITLQFLEQAGKNQQPFEPLVERVDRLYAKCFRGVDLATGSRAGGVMGGNANGGAVGASVQGEESGIFLLRDAKWATGYLNERVDRPVIRTLFDQEARAAFVVQPPAEDTANEDLQVATGLVPLGLRISLKEAYKRFRWKAPEAGEPCLAAPQIPGGASSASPTNGNGNGNGKLIVPPKPKPVVADDAPQSADKSEQETQDAQSTDETPIAAGADPARNPGLLPPRSDASTLQRSNAFSVGSRQMPDPQVDAGAFWSAAAATARAMMPSMGYAIPNSRAPNVDAQLLANAIGPAGDAWRALWGKLGPRLRDIAELQDEGLFKGAVKKLHAEVNDPKGELITGVMADRRYAQVLANAMSAGFFNGIAATISQTGKKEEETGRKEEETEAANA